MNLDSNLPSASIYIPHVKEWASIVGACMEDGKFQLIWKTSSQKLGTLDLDLVQELVKNLAVPF